MQNPNRQYQYYPDQQALNTLFEIHDFSFRDPNRAANILERLLREQLRAAYIFTNEDSFYNYVRRSNAGELWRLLQDISFIPRHRHRFDAANILQEVTARVFERVPPETLLPNPLEPDYEGLDGIEPDFASEELETLYRAEIVAAARQVAWRPGDDLPVGWLNPLVQTTRLEYLPPNNDAMMALITQDLATSQRVRMAMENMFSAGEHPQINLPPIYRDDPAEICLQLPEDCRFLTTPTPMSVRMEALRNQPRPDLCIWDMRRRETNDIFPLRETNYIYQLVSLVRDTVANPDIARAYTIIFRANPLRYARDSVDEIVNEEPPTVGES